MAKPTTVQQYQDAETDVLKAVLMLLKQRDLGWDWVLRKIISLQQFLTEGKQTFNGFSGMGKESLAYSTVLWTDLQGLYFFISFPTKGLIFQNIFFF